MKLKNSDIVPILQIILTYQDEKPFNGLLLEEIPLSLKRRLQRIRKELLSKHEQFVKDAHEVKENGNKPEDLEELLKEEFTINEDMVSLEMIENINTKHVYDFDFIEKIAR